MKYVALLVVAMLTVFSACDTASTSNPQDNGENNPPEQASPYDGLYHIDASIDSWTCKDTPKIQEVPERVTIEIKDDTTITISAGDEWIGKWDSTTSHAVANSDTIWVITYGSFYTVFDITFPDTLSFTGTCTIYRHVIPTSGDPYDCNEIFNVYGEKQ